MTEDRKNKDTPAHPDRDHSGGTQRGGQADPRDTGGRQPPVGSPDEKTSRDVHDKDDIRQ